MKKLILVLLTAAASGMVACFAGCSEGQTGGGDSAKSSESSSVQTRGAQENAADEGDFGFLPPDMPMSGDENFPHGLPMSRENGLPPVPHGQMFGMRPEFMPEHRALSGVDGNTDGNTPEKMPEPKGRIRRKKNGNKGDMVTPDGNFTPDNARAGGNDTNTEDSGSEKSTEDKAIKKAPQKRNKRNGKRTEDTKEEK